MVKAYLETRTIGARGTWPHRGPDRGVFVQIVPDGEVPLKVLNRKVAQKRGIIIINCGVGYYNRCTKSNSMYNIAVTKAEKIVEAINNC